MEEKRGVTEEKEITDDYTEEEDEELWKWRQMSMKRGSTLIASDDDNEDEDEADDVFKEENSSECDRSLEVRRNGIQRRTQYGSKKQQSLNFELDGCVDVPHNTHLYGPRRSSYLSEEENYRSMSALDQLKLFQKQQGLENDDLSHHPSSQAFTSRPKTTGRLGGRERSKTRRSRSIFGQGAPIQQ